MPELIDRYALLTKIYDNPPEKARMDHAEWYRKCIYEAPTIKPEVRHGRWLSFEGWFNKSIVKCSICGNTLNMDGVNAGRGDANFCPNCGARMDMSCMEGGDDEG